MFLIHKDLFLGVAWEVFFLINIWHLMLTFCVLFRYDEEMNNDSECVMM